MKRFLLFQSSKKCLLFDSRVLLLLIISCIFCVASAIFLPCLCIVRLSYLTSLKLKTFYFIIPQFWCRWTSSSDVHNISFIFGERFL
jgi:hypothetical protein